jgi:RNA polymerase sigma-70 factor (ECF subfamily)
LLPRASPEAPAPDPDAALLEGVRAGREDAFAELVERHQASLLRLARYYVRDGAVAEEVVQDAWVGVLRGLDGFAGRSSFRTWLFHILVNRARSTGVRERRSVAIGDSGPAVDAARFDAAGAWLSPPERWIEDVDERIFAGSLAAPLEAALAALPARQREVVLLRDVSGLSTAEVSQALGISDANGRVLLHRGRSRLRQALEDAIGSAARC